MKKYFISAIAILSQFSVYSQSTDEETFNRIYASVYPDLTAPGTQGDTNGFSVIPECSGSQMQFTVSKTKGNYEAVKLYFRNNLPDDVSTDPNTIDLRNNSNFSFDIQNLSAKELKIRVEIQDINDSLINTWYTFADKPVSDTWKYYIGKSLPPSMAAPKPFSALATEDPTYIVIPSHTPFASSNKFAGGFNAIFVPEPGKCYGTFLKSNKFDFSRVKSINFVIFSKDLIDNICFEPVAINDVKIAISNLKIGDYEVFCDVVMGLPAENAVTQTSISPNPAADFTTIRYNTENDVTVSVYDLNGSLVLSANGNNREAVLNTAELKTGLYMVTVEADGVVSKPEKLFVK
jgi:hypothetical protein